MFDITNVHAPLPTKKPKLDRINNIKYNDLPFEFTDTINAPIKFNLIYRIWDCSNNLIPLNLVRLLPQTTTIMNTRLSVSKKDIIIKNELDLRCKLLDHLQNLHVSFRNRWLLAEDLLAIVNDTNNGKFNDMTVLTNLLKKQ